MITEHCESIYGLPALTDDIADMIADGQMIGHCYSEDLYLRRTVNVG